MAQQPACEPSPVSRLSFDVPLRPRSLVCVGGLNLAVFVEVDDRAAIDGHRDARLFERMVERLCELFEFERRKSRRKIRQQVFEFRPLFDGSRAWRARYQLHRHHRSPRSAAQMAGTSCSPAVTFGT
jgi:hypothetical protein